VTPERRFYAFLAVLGALLVMFVAACILAYNNRSVEAIGISGALTGLIALAGTLAGQRQPTDHENQEEPRL
jgi:membrane associated rhomboid family serine protease